MYQFSRPKAGHPELSVPPKRILAERLLRSVAARSVKSGSEFELRQSRFVEVRRVSASKGPPRSFAFVGQNPRSVLSRMFRHLKSAAQANRFQRLAGRFSSSSVRSVKSVVSVVSQSRSVASRLN